MKSLFLLPVCSFLCCLPCLSPAQNTSTAYPAKQLHIRKTDQAVKVDGLLDDPAWKDAEVAQGFYLQFPVDTGYSDQQTTVRVSFDDRYFYVSAVCYEPREDYTVQSLRRDFGPGTGDVFNLLLDPTKDGLNGFIFGVGPLNVQREALVSNGENLSYEWDNKWLSAVQSYDDRWEVEIAIPFKTLRYTVSPGENSWHINFTRARLKDFEVTTWTHIPYVYRPNNLAFTGMLHWDTPPPKPGVNVSLIPYAIGNYGIDYRRDANSLELLDKDHSLKPNLGGDVKIAVTPGLNLDLTLNPDFSQVEVDRQVANLSRFELFFPELRQFFLENRDLFAMFGFPDTRPFFSRRIGLAYNPVSEQYERVPILAGARLSGKLNDKWRIGILNMQTGKKTFDAQNVLPGANFGVVTAQRRVLQRSTLSGIFVNKQNFLSDLSTTQRADWQPWNRVAGLEFNLYSKDNRWEGESYYHRSFSPDPKQRGATMAQFIGYNDRKINLFAGFNRIDSTYSAEAGFVPRPGVQGLYAGGGIQFYPQRGWAKRAIANTRLGLESSVTYNLAFRETDRDLFLNLSTFFRNQSQLTFGIYNAYTRLFDDFDPTRLIATDEIPLPQGSTYTYSGFRADYASSTSFDWQMNLRLNAGGYFNGSYVSATGNFIYRRQPLGSIALNYSYNNIRLPQPYPSADFWLVGPRIELAFTRNFFTSALFQYNTQANNFNLNARVQWRFAPVSDLFLVYTDNSYAESIPLTPIRFLSAKNKALVLKVVYWLNV